MFARRSLMSRNNAMGHKNTSTMDSRKPTKNSSPRISAGKNVTFQMICKLPITYMTSLNAVTKQPIAMSNSAFVRGRLNANTPIDNVSAAAQACSSGFNHSSKRVVLGKSI